MRTHLFDRLFGTLAVIALLLLPLGMSAAQEPTRQPAPAPAQPLPTDQLIIKYRPLAGLDGVAGAPQMQRLSDAAGVELTYAREMSGDAHVLRLPGRIPQAEAQAIADRLSALPEVAYAEPDAIMTHTTAPPNDPLYANQWHYAAPVSNKYGINAQAAWDITTGSAGIVIAVIDTGITNHADLSGRAVPGYDFIADVPTANDGDGRDSDPSDPGDWITLAESQSGPFQGCPVTDSSWHGTHTAGTVGAATNNGLGVAGVNWKSKILPVRVLGKCGGYLSDIADGMRWSAGLAVTGVPANANPAKVLNLSLGGPGACGSTYQNAVNAVVATGATVVVSAGNDNVDASGYAPANCNGVITVAATNRAGSRAYYSNFGNTVEISAPGGETNVVTLNGVLSTLNTGTQGPIADTYDYYQGTSMAAPHVSGVAGLLYSLNPALSPVQILTILQNTVTSFPPGSTCNTSICGRGIVNAGAAVASIAGTTPTPTATPTVTRTPTPTPTFAPFTPTAFVRLPLVLKSNPLPTPTPTMAPDPIVNGGFESGPTGWTQYSGHGWPLIVTPPELIVPPHGGSWAAWLGGGNNETAYIQQQVAISAGRSYLAYWHWIASEDYCGYDRAIVAIGDAWVDVYELCQSKNTNGWVKHVVDLSAYIKRSVTLQIRVETDSSLNSNLFVDDVALQPRAAALSAGEPPDYDPTLPADARREPGDPSLLPARPRGER